MSFQPPNEVGPLTNKAAMHKFSCPIHSSVLVGGELFSHATLDYRARSSNRVPNMFRYLSVQGLTAFAGLPLAKVSVNPKINSSLFVKYFQPPFHNKILINTATPSSESILFLASIFLVLHFSHHRSMPYMIT